MEKYKILDPNLLHDEAEKLRNFLSEKLVGQKRAIDHVVKSYDYYL